MYLIGPQGELFQTYCDMETDGGGWTVTFTYFYPDDGIVYDDPGTPSNPCYSQTCTNRAYSTVPITSDIMLEVSDQAILDNDPWARVRINGVHPDTIGHDARTLLTTPGPWYAEAEDNSNLELEFFGPMAGTTCDTLDTWGDFRGVVCDTNVLTFYDQDACNVNGVYQIGSSFSYTEPHGNCNGMFASPTNNWPHWARMWVR